MADISKINVNGTEYDIRSTVPTLKVSTKTVSGEDPDLSLNLFNAYGNIYKINLIIEVETGKSQSIILRDEKHKWYTPIFGSGVRINYDGGVNPDAPNEVKSIFFYDANFKSGNIYTITEGLTLEFKNGIKYLKFECSSSKPPATYYLELTLCKDLW